MITTGLATSAKLGWLTGQYVSTDVYKMALYTNAAVLDSTTTSYTSAGEVTGVGYSVGGVAMTGYNAAIAGSTAILTFDDPSWPNATITAAGALIYNNSKANAAIAVVSFNGDVTSTNGTFTVKFPAFTESEALIKFT